jgi:hypothetical protein
MLERPRHALTISSPASEASVGGGGSGRFGPETEGADRSEEGEVDPPLRSTTVGDTRYLEQSEVAVISKTRLTCYRIVARV